ncbi:hypothetical protein BpHYR1_051311 [Brachionus plicatilis]|uniref:Uncharacterized protein n=1 Tax=Brachionus plicatilis TaxID=10195 RepID=A0A3M7STB7_BRAPC|nr:hypothetical protein BpHYR1_051311 [Brachionus plicatilis]
MSLLMVGWAVFGLTILLQQIDRVDFKKSNTNQYLCSQNLYLTSLTSSIFELSISLFYFFQSIDNFSEKQINNRKQKSLKIYNPRTWFKLRHGPNGRNLKPNH